MVVVLDDLDVLSANIDMRCSLSSTALAEVAEYVGLVWVSFEPVRQRSFSQVGEHGGDLVKCTRNEKDIVREP